MIYNIFRDLVLSMTLLNKNESVKEIDEKMTTVTNYLLVRKRVMTKQIFVLMSLLLNQLSKPKIETEIRGWKNTNDILRLVQRR